MAKCRGCGEEIIFIKSPAGKFIKMRRKTPFLQGYSMIEIDMRG